jgi:hypothetical protein
VILKKREYYLSRFKSKKVNTTTKTPPPPKRIRISSKPMDTKRPIDLQTKKKILDDVENGVSHKEIVSRYNLKSLSNISVILKNREHYMSEINNPLSCSQSKLVKRSKYRHIEDLLHKYLREKQQDLALVSDDFIKEKATEIAVSMGMEQEFCFSEAYIKNLKVSVKFRRKLVKIFHI